MTSIIFVSIYAGDRKAFCPELRDVEEGLRLHPAKHVFADPDIGEVNLAAMQAARQQQMAGLAAKEGYCFAGSDRGTLDFSACSIDAARQIHGVDLCRRRIDRLDHATCEALNGPVEAGAKQRID